MNIPVMVLSKGGRGGAEKHAGQLVRQLLSEGHEAKLFATGAVVGNIRTMVEDAIPACALEQLTGAELFENPPDWGKLLAGLEADRIVLEKGHITQGSREFHQAASKNCNGYVVVEQTTPPRLREGVLPFPVVGIRRPGLWRLPIIWRHARNARLADAIVSVSDENRGILEKQFFYPRRRCHTIHNSVDTARFVPSHEARSRFRADFGIAEETFVFGAVGRLSREKNLACAIRASAAVREAMHASTKTFRFVIFGDGGEEGTLKALVAEFGLKDTVVFGGFTDAPETIYPGFDMLVMSSLGEGLPLNLVESFACGCPAVCTAVGGIPEVITDPGLGWLVPSDDAEALANAMIESMQRPSQEIRSMGIRCRRHAEAHFNARTQLKKYTELIAQGRSRK